MYFNANYGVVHKSFLKSFLQYFSRYIEMQIWNVGVHSP